MKFALTAPAPDAVALIDDERGWCWPFYDVEDARKTAREVGRFGFWRKKR